MLKFLWLCKNPMKILSLKVSIAIRMYTVDTGTGVHCNKVAISLILQHACSS